MMIPEERRRNILVRLKENDFLKIDDIAEKLGVSKITVIRDIQLLKNQGLVKKIHGGIKLDGPSKNSIESSFYERMQKNYSKKLEIAGKSLPFLEGKQTVFLDSSSTVFVLATEIFKSHYNEKNLITNSPAIIVEAMNYPGVHLISTDRKSVV